MRVIGDFNAKLRKENIQGQVTYKYILHDVTDGNVIMLAEFAVRNSLVIMTTFFSSKEFILELGGCLSWMY